eukprot:8252878-Pyramimonas_sp.AAC.2
MASNQRSLTLGFRLFELCPPKLPSPYAMWWQYRCRTTGLNWGATMLLDSISSTLNTSSPVWLR